MKVSLSILLPFLSAPLIYLTSSKKVMRVIVYAQPPAYTQSPPVETEPLMNDKTSVLPSYTQLASMEKDPARSTTNGDDKSTTVLTAATLSDSEMQGVEFIDMANGWITTILGWLIWVFIAGLNVYLIVVLALGNS
jgi:metal iron transporter